MANLAGIVRQLRKERERADGEISGLNAALQAFVGAYGGKAKPKPTPTRQRRKMSVSARKKIAAAQRARWAKVKKAKA
jgi:hypothetical protein